MTKETKTLLVIIAIVIAGLVGAAFFVSSSNPLSSSTSTVANVAALVRKNSNQKMVPNAKVTLVEFGDFECPACGSVQPLVRKILENNKGKITYVFRNYPLPQHKNALVAAEAAEAAGAQGKYWEMHDLLYEKQSEWSDSTSPLDLFVGYSRTLKLNEKMFTNDVKSNKYQGKIQQDTDDGTALAISQTPSFFVNGTLFTGNNGIDLAKAVKDAMKP
jgi:protein-disulfide isomerase